MAVSGPVRRFEFESAGFGIEARVFDRKTFKVPIHPSAGRSRPHHAGKIRSIPVKFERDGVSVVKRRTEVADPGPSELITAVILFVFRTRGETKESKNRDKMKLLHCELLRIFFYENKLWRIVMIAWNRCGKFPTNA